MTKEKVLLQQTSTADTPAPVSDPTARPRRNLSAAGRQRLRDAALRNRPWEYSTGPKTPAGKARVAQNGRWRQRGGKSKRAIKTEIQEALATTDRLAELTQLLEASEPPVDRQG